MLIPTNKSKPQGRSGEWPVSRLMIGFLLGILIVFGGTGFLLVFLQIGGAMAVLQEQSLKAEAKALAVHVDSYLQSRLTILEDLASFPIITSTVMNPQNLTSDVRDFMESISLLGSKPLLSLLDFQGISILVNAAYSTNVSHNHEDVPLILDSKISNSTVVVFHRGKPYWRLTVPVLYNGLSEGMLSAEFPVDLPNLLGPAAPGVHRSVSLVNKGRTIVSMGSVFVHSISVQENLFPPGLSVRYQSDFTAIKAFKQKLLLEIALVMGALAAFCGWLFSRLGRRLFVVPQEQLISFSTNLEKEVTQRRQSEEQLELALHGADLGLWDWDNQKGVITSNRRWGQILGYSQSEVQNDLRWRRSLIHPEDSLRNWEAMNEHLTGRTPGYDCVYRLKAKTGGWRWVLDRGKVVERSKDGQPLRTAGTTLDITEYRLAQDALKRSEKRFRDIAHSMADWIWEMDKEGVFTYCSDRVESILGYTPAEIMGKSVFSLFAKDEVSRLREIFQQIQKEALPIEDTELWAVHKGGRLVCLRTGAVPVFNRRGQHQGYRGVCTDITIRKNAKLALAKAHQREIEVGTHIQQTLLLGNPPETLEGIEFAAHTIASQTIDGDFYDFFDQSKTICDLIIGDVMGKGIPAALLGAATKSIFPLAMNKLVLASPVKLPGLKEIVQLVHKLVVKELISLESFVTLVYARFDLDKMLLQFVDCGHTRTIHYCQDTQATAKLQGKNMPLGFSLEDSFETIQVDLKPCDVLVFYSDGVTEAASPEGEMWGEDRLAACVAANIHLPLAGLIQTIHKDIISFSGKDSFSDDLTLVAAKVGWPAGQIPVVRQERVYPAELEQLPAMREYITEILQQSSDHADPDSLYSMVLAVNEAATNIIKHGYKKQHGLKITLKASIFDDRWEVRLYHSGEYFHRPLPLLSPPTGGQESGYGLFIIDQTVDAHRYLTDEAGKHFIFLVKKR